MPTYLQTVFFGRCLPQYIYLKQYLELGGQIIIIIFKLHENETSPFYFLDISLFK